MSSAVCNSFSYRFVLARWTFLRAVWHCASPGGFAFFRWRIIDWILSLISRNSLKNDETHFVRFDYGANVFYAWLLFAFVAFSPTTLTKPFGSKHAFALKPWKLFPETFPRSGATEKSFAVIPAKVALSTASKFFFLLSQPPSVRLKYPVNAMLTCRMSLLKASLQGLRQ